jgi:hypothetical protein
VFDIAAQKGHSARRPPSKNRPLCHILRALHMHRLTLIVCETGVKCSYSCCPAFFCAQNNPSMGAPWDGSDTKADSGALSISCSLSTCKKWQNAATSHFCMYGHMFCQSATEAFSDCMAIPYTTRTSSRSADSVLYSCRLNNKPGDNVQ